MSKNYGESQYPTAHILALTTDGKRFIHLQSNVAREQQSNHQEQSIPNKCHQLIGVLTERKDNNKRDENNRMTICIEPRQLKTLTLGLRVENEENCVKFEDQVQGGGPMRQKIPRPANAFMLFANEWRKKLAVENPRESNKEISVRLANRGYYKFSTIIAN